MSHKQADYDLEMRIRLLTTAEGGRHTDIGGYPLEFYSCPIDRGDAHMYDCRVWLNGQRLKLGESYKVRASLLDPEHSLGRFQAGDQVTLWEGRTIGRGTVVDVRVKPERRGQ